MVVAARNGGIAVRVEVAVSLRWLHRRSIVFSLLHVVIGTVRGDAVSIPPSWTDEYVAATGDEQNPSNSSPTQAKEKSE